MWYKILNIISYISVTLLCVMVIQKLISCIVGLFKLSTRIDPIVEMRLSDFLAFLVAFVLVYAFITVEFPHK